MKIKKDDKMQEELEELSIEISLIKKFINDIEIIYNAKSWGDMQTECELASERYYDLLLNNYQIDHR